MKRLARAAAAAIVALGLLQLVPVERDNPPLGVPLDAPQPVAGILRASCYDCHSNETRWPWYSRVAPASWLVANDVHEARHQINFSDWGARTSNEQARMRAEIAEEVEAGEMPPARYLLAHRDARLTPERQQALVDWAAGTPAPNARTPGR